VFIKKEQTMQRVMVMVMMSLVLVGCGGSGGLMGRMFPSPTPIPRYVMADILCDPNYYDLSIFASIMRASDENGHRGYRITVRNDTSQSTLQIAACILQQMQVPLDVTEKITNTREEGIKYNEKVNDLDISWVKDTIRDEIIITIIDLRD
jgi:hypothetical protein